MRKNQNRVVFIVEDNDLYSMMLDYTLTNETNVQCFVFRTGEECIKNLNLNPMLVILDYWLPGINGGQTLDEIKKIDPLIPVVMLTKDKDEKIEKQLLSKNIHEYFHKEVNSISQIVRTVNSFIDKIDQEERRSNFFVKLIFILLFFLGILLVLTYIN